jgi:hypothetical protein
MRFNVVHEVYTGEKEHNNERGGGKGEKSPKIKDQEWKRRWYNEE